MCCLAVYVGFNAKTFHLRLFWNQAVSVFEKADFLSCKVAGVVPSSTQPCVCGSHQTTSTSEDLCLWSNSHEVTRTLVWSVCCSFSACFCERRGKLWRASPTLSQHDSWSSQEKPVFKLNTSKFVLFLAFWRRLTEPPACVCSGLV